MCGIAGIIGKNTDAKTLGRMLSSQSHRGPDATGEYLNPGFAALGHNRLSIIDLSAEANQPFSDASGRYWLTFNGEIYNYIELREILLDHYTFRTVSDTEVLLAAYITWGKDCLDRLNGMFAFAILDNVDKTLFAARDRFGVKPFYYSRQEEFWFASEIKTLHAAGIPKSANEKTWASYFAYGSYGNPHETFWNGISQLPGGHFLEIIDGKMSVAKWYDFEYAVKRHPSCLSSDEVKSRYINLLKDSVRLRFRADVPVGFNISGGLDSSVLLAMVRNFDHDSGNINAYTFYTGNPDYDELPWVEKLINKTHYPLYKVLLSAADVPALSEKMHLQQDEPFGGIPTLAYAAIFRQARRAGTIVLLDGQGMDEQWAGYDYYTKPSGDVIQGVSGSAFRTSMLSPAFLAEAIKPEYPKPFDNDLQNMQYRDLFYTKIPRALRFNDRVSMAFSTELREPFLDYRLVEFAFSLPEEYKIRDGQTKFLLREIAAEYLSDDLVLAPKRPLQTPQREWLGIELRQWTNEHFEKAANICPDWFDKAGLIKEWESYLAGDSQSAFHIWQVISAAALMSDYN